MAFALRFSSFNAYRGNYSSHFKTREFFDGVVTFGYIFDGLSLVSCSVGVVWYPAAEYWQVQ